MINGMLTQNILDGFFVKSTELKSSICRANYEAFGCLD